MTKYEIYTAAFELDIYSGREHYLPSMTAEEIFDEARKNIGANGGAFLEASFGAEAEAMAEIDRHSDYYSGRTFHHKGGPDNAWTIITGSVAWVEEVEYDDDGEYDQGLVVSYYAAPYSSPEEE